MHLNLIVSNILYSIYTEKEYKDRQNYLNSVSDEYGVDINIVNSLADILGPDEDFDGLISILQDMDYFM